MAITTTRIDRDPWMSPTACEIADAVWSVHRSYRLVCGLASSQATAQLRRRQLQRPNDRREENRTGICVPVDLIPVRAVDERLVIAGPPIAGVTRDLASHGAGLRHDRPIPTRFAVAEFDVFGEPVRLLIELRWTRDEDVHSFISGGRIVAVVDAARMVGRPPAPDHSPAI
ncbi:MAG: hypothetical protein KF774_20890 [Planctomyces sp.]|nr:hypothetical protein [Planctomyces sp.]